MTWCKKCRRFLFNGKHKCQKCSESDNASQKKMKEKIPRCKGFESGNFKGYRKVNANELTPCKHFQPQDCTYCSFHSYMKDYNEHKLNNLSQCCGCHKIIYIEGEYKTCLEFCRSRKEKEKKIKNDDVKKCKHSGCTFLPSKTSKFEEYCGKHQTEAWKINVEKEGKKVCANYVRGCRIELSIDYEKERCEECLEKYRISDKKRRDNWKPKIIDNKRECKGKKCHKMFDMDGNEFKTSLGNDTDYCSKCRKDHQETDSKRDRSGRDTSKYEKSEHGKSVRAEWRRENPEKSAIYSRSYRKRLKDRPDYQDILKKNADWQKQWRKDNPEKMAERYKRDKVNVKRKIDGYKQSAKKRGKKFELSDKEASNLLMGICFYCGLEPIIDLDKTCNIQRRNDWYEDGLEDDGGMYVIGLNGIDRIDNDKDYNTKNVVTCCKWCNYMKNDYNNDDFFDMIEHILTVNKFIDGNLNVDAFQFYKGLTYGKTISTAKVREIDFKLTKEEFVKLKNNNCYICQRENTIDHKNGIDRVNNDVCYVSYNCLTCCGDCNYMKRTLSLASFFNHIVCIYNHNSSLKVSYEYFKLNMIIILENLGISDVKVNNCDLINKRNTVFKSSNNKIEIKK